MKRTYILLLSVFFTAMAFGQIPVDIKFAENKAQGEAFLVENAKKKDVVALPSGLQYKIITQGTGVLPKATDKVKANYSGTLLDGTKFDSSYDRGEPAVFPVNRLIKGWTEALQLMPVGSKWILYVPQYLSYGSMQRNLIPPYSTLIFELELISIEK